MIRLKLTNKPITIALGFGVSVTCEPLTSAVFASARNDAAIAPLDVDRSNSELVTVDLVKAIARRTITAWDGIGDAEGNVIDPDPVAINAMIDTWQLYDAFNTLFVAPFLILRDEGNAFASSPNGTSAGVLDTVKTVTKPAKPAPTKSTSPKPSRAPKSGI